MKFSQGDFKRLSEFLDIGDRNSILVTQNGEYRHQHLKVVTNTSSAASITNNDVTFENECSAFGSICNIGYNRI